MASYDLKCRSCGKDFEVFVIGFLKDDAKVCPDCGGREVDQRFTGFGGVLGLSPAYPSCADGAPCEPHRCGMASGCGCAG
jgi:putative FmdB family regulatory protein